MTRLTLQLALGLLLGVLTTATAPEFEGVDFLTATVVATAASTVIAPRFWWAGLVAFWIGQSVGWSITNINELTADPLSGAFRALLVPYVVSSRSMLVGAVIGGALWHLVDLRRKRIAMRNAACELSA
jgi:hypothetical protein